MMIASESLPQESTAPETPQPSHAKPDSMSESYRDYLAKLSELATPEEKIALGLDFMRKSISQEGTPRFREFWEARRDLLSLFKQNLNPAIRSKLWNEYVELTVEARRLKEILEEQSAFAMEQIDLAITALEQDVSNFDALLAQIPAISWPSDAKAIQGEQELYNQIQRELNLLNHLATRLNGLRKEIIKTEMRIRFKTRFFKRLSELGNQIFPKRKQLIERIGELFERDIDQFVERHFKGEEVIGAPYYALRDEIKALQGLAKLITLNTNVFTKTRLKLSECWDKIKVLEKVHKQEFQQKKQVWSENRAAMEAKFSELKKQLEGQDLKQIDLALEEFQKELRAVEIGKEDMAYFRQEMARMRAPFIALQEQKRRELEQAERDKLQQKKEKIQSLKDQLARLQKSTDQNVDELAREFDQIRSDIEGLSLNKFELQQFERLLRPVKDLIAERKENALMNLSDDEKNALQQLRDVLEQRKLRRQEIKDQLEIYRKMLGGSNLDFEKAMAVREQIEFEKERLEKANASILEVEQKIAEIEENA
jgi:DNA repair exonuclease SbcCD ATPase subunit